MNRVNPGLWPPNVENEVGSPAYHFASMIAYVVEVFNSISDAPENDVLNKIPKKQTLISRILSLVGNWLLALSERAN